MIPKILHQIFISNTMLQEPPALWNKFTKKAKRIHKSWEYIFWNKNNLYTLIETQYPQFMDYFTDSVPFVIQSDIGRYLILKHMGGWYFDCDYEIIKSLDDWKDNSIILPQERAEVEGKQQAYRIGNSILASEQGHWFWDSILETLPEPSFFTPDITHEDIMITTGPKKLSDIFNALPIEKKTQIACPHRLAFHHPTIVKMTYREYNRILSMSEVYGIHHTHSSWRDKDLLKNINRRKLYANPFMNPVITVWERYLYKKRNPNPPKS